MNAKTEYLHQLLTKSTCSYPWLTYPSFSTTANNSNLPTIHSNTQTISIRTTVNNMCCAIITMGKRTSDTECQQPRANKRPKILMSALPDRMLQTKLDQESSPEHFLMKTVPQNVTVQPHDHEDLTGFFHPPTQVEIDAYDHHVLAAIRSQDMETLRQFHQQGRPLKCSNKFGESLLHMACRKGMLQVASFLVNEANVPFAVKDDYGRTPLSDACWAHTTNFELVDLILSQCPDLLYIKDKRGNTPLSYLKQDKWAAWNKYLQSKPAEFFLPKSKLCIHA